MISLLILVLIIMCVLGAIAMFHLKDETARDMCLWIFYLGAITILILSLFL